MGRHHGQLAAAALRLPDGLPGFDPEPLRLLGLCQHDAVAQLRVAAHGHGPAAQRRIVPLLHGGVEIIQIRVQDDPFHRFATKQMFYSYCMAAALRISTSKYW